jgi:hypothetical protein
MAISHSLNLIPSPQTLTTTSPLTTTHLQRLHYSPVTITLINQRKTTILKSIMLVSGNLIMTVINGMTLRTHIPDDNTERSTMHRSFPSSRRIPLLCMELKSQKYSKRLIKNVMLIKTSNTFSQLYP